MLNKAIESVSQTDSKNSTLPVAAASDAKPPAFVPETNPQNEGQVNASGNTAVNTETVTVTVVNEEKTPMPTATQGAPVSAASIVANVAPPPPIPATQPTNPEPVKIAATAAIPAATTSTRDIVVSATASENSKPHPQAADTEQKSVSPDSTTPATPTQASFLAPINMGLHTRALPVTRCVATQNNAGENDDLDDMQRIFDAIKSIRKIKNPHTKQQTFSTLSTLYAALGDLNNQALAQLSQEQESATPPRLVS